MPPDDKQEKPMPSAAEINAYLELSAARTKKRLTLAAGNAAPMKATGKVARKALFTGPASPGSAPERAARAQGQSAVAPPGEPGAAASPRARSPNAVSPGAVSPGAASPDAASTDGASPDGAESTWRPFSDDEI
jgi:hypothetical protein